MTIAPLLTVSANRIVAVRYIMRNRYLEVLEDRMTGQPAVYLQGGESIMLPLQMQLEGMQAGDRKQVTLCLQDGGTEPDFFFDVEILSVRPASEAEQNLGYALPVAEDCGPDCDCYGVSPATDDPAPTKPV